MKSLNKKKSKIEKNHSESLVSVFISCLRRRRLSSSTDFNFIQMIALCNTVARLLQIEMKMSLPLSAATSSSLSFSVAVADF